MRPLCAVLLAAGEGRRLAPLTEIVPKALCPVGNIALLDRALAAARGLGLAGAGEVAVNAWHHSAAIVAHTGALAYINVETGQQPLGSAGGLAALRDWIDGRDVLAGNADAYLAGGDLTALLRDRERGDEVVRLLGVPAEGQTAEFGTHRFAGFTLIPWRYVAALRPEPTDLVREVWRPAEAAGELRVIEYAGRYIDCGTPGDYLAANLDAAARSGNGGNLIAPDARVDGTVTASVIGAGATVRGTVDRVVVWPGGVVEEGEDLTSAVRYAGSATVRIP